MKRSGNFGRVEMSAGYNCHGEDDVYYDDTARHLQSLQSRNFQPAKMHSRPSRRQPTRPFVLLTQIVPIQLALILGKFNFD